MCLTFPAIGAVRDGYDVYAVMDASGTVNPHALQAAMFRMSQAGVKIANANMVIAEILADWGGRYAAPVGKLYAGRVPNFGFIAAHLARQAALKKSLARLVRFTAPGPGRVVRAPSRAREVLR